MASNFHEQYEQHEAPLPSERSTGLVFAAVALIVAWLWRANATALYGALTAAVAFAAVSLLAPRLLRPLNIAWMKLAMLLNRIMSPVIMAVLFLIAIVPAGLIMQLCRDPLRRRRPKSAETYWIERQTLSPPGSMTNQF